MFEVEDRRQASQATNAEGFVDRRKGPETRRKFQRWKTFKGAAIAGRPEPQSNASCGTYPTAAPALRFKCPYRSASST